MRHTTRRPVAGVAPPAVGVLDGIIANLESGGGSVLEIVAKLSKKFPDRDADGLTATVRAQMSRLETTRNLKIKASDTSPRYLHDLQPILSTYRGPFRLVSLWSSSSRIALGSIRVRPGRPSSQ